jgi:hypothetical protein
MDRDNAITLPDAPAYLGPAVSYRRPIDAVLAPVEHDKPAAITPTERARVAALDMVRDGLARIELAGGDTGSLSLVLRRALRLLPVGAQLEIAASVVRECAPRGDGLDERTARVHADNAEHAIGDMRSAIDRVNGAR